MIDAEDLAALEASQADHSKVVDVEVTGCAYACCGRGWQRRDGYEQAYCGYVDNLEVGRRPDPSWSGELVPLDGTFMLYSLGVGTISYVVAVRFSEVLGVQPRTAGVA